MKQRLQAPLDALKAFPGKYEIHITIFVPDQGALQRFIGFCAAQEAKAIVIQLSSGRHCTQPMLCKRIGGEPDTVWAHVQALCEGMISEGFAVERLKIEAAIDNANIPQSDEVAAQLPDYCYFEHHLKLRLPADYDLDALRKAVREYRGRLSTNAFWRNYEHMEQFVTQRIRGGAPKAGEVLNALRAFLAANEVTIVKEIREFNIYDSNIGLDADWGGASAEAHP
ncbi:conserved hypothetical protein [Hahella chejuensis KCTC 2396]|uniref:Uncharacterized protein n=1 Tax=Hahella chejuensis (strain KCTC 2396) TaxID=349521 RepID=Q2SE74_HAHCH|nr:hypothetical protein [Hahella chejuensis]ABC31050.1 conserved hypothetical protein [Hahella chejuensis KCTC 2396]